MDYFNEPYFFVMKIFFDRIRFIHLIYWRKLKLELIKCLKFKGKRL